MKLFNQFNVLPRYLTAFNYAGLNLNETPQELEKCTPEFQNFWDKECREHPTNQNCLIYCDWVINFYFLIYFKESVNNSYSLSFASFFIFFKTFSKLWTNSFVLNNWFLLLRVKSLFLNSFNLFLFFE